MQQLGQRKWQVGVRDAAPEQRRRSAEIFQGTEQMVEEFVEGVRAAVCESSLGESPYPLIGIEFGGVAGEVLQMKARMASAALAQLGSGVNATVIEQHDDVAAKMAKELAEEGVNFLMGDVAQREVAVETQTAAAWTHRDARNHRDLVPMSAVAQQRSLPAGCPGLEHGRNQQEAGFVHKDKVRPQARGFFFTRGQSTCFHRAIAVSSRSAARRSGF